MCHRQHCGGGPAGEKGGLAVNSSGDGAGAGARRRGGPGSGDPGQAERSLAAVLAALDGGQPPPRPELRTAVRYLLDLLAAKAPGRAIEVRIPPYAAVQCGAGPQHTRGTPPNVVETDPVTWIRLATGGLTWAEASGSGQVSASGVRADLSAFLPLVLPPALG
jgi:Bacterial SCP ortholog